MRSISAHSQHMELLKLRRAVSLPESLLVLMPKVEQWRDHSHGSSVQHEQMDLVATGCVNLLFALREVILQNSEYVIDRYPHSPVWRHPVFRDAEYSPWADQVRAVMAGDHLALNHFAQATRAHPELAQLLTISNSRQRAKVNGRWRSLRLDYLQNYRRLAGGVLKYWYAPRRVQVPQENLELFRKLGLQS